MRTEQQNVALFHKAAGIEDPVVPTIPSLEVRILRAKLILEEALETIRKGLEVEYAYRHGTLGLLEHIELILKDKTATWIATGPGNLIQIADGCADIKYVTNGTALACGIDMEPIDDEVQRSNMSKFIDGHRREDGKWVKGPSYSPADLHEILATQQKIKFRHPDPPAQEKPSTEAPGAKEEPS